MLLVVSWRIITHLFCQRRDGVDDPLPDEGQFPQIFALLSAAKVAFAFNLSTVFCNYATQGEVLFWLQTIYSAGKNYNHLKQLVVTCCVLFAKSWWTDFHILTMSYSTDEWQTLAT